MSSPTSDPLSARDISGAIFVGLFGAAVAVWALPKLLGVVFTLALAVLFGLMLDAPTAWAVRRGAPRPAAAFFFAGLGATVTFGGAALIVPQVRSQAELLSSRHGDLADTSAQRINELAQLLPFRVPEVDSQSLVDLAAQTSATWTAWARGASLALLFAVVAAFVALWAVAYPRPLFTRLLRLVPPAHRTQVRSLSRAVERTLRRWVVGQLSVMAAVAVGTYAVLKTLGVPFAELFAVAAGLLEAVPTIGIILSSAGPVLLVGLDDPSSLPWLLGGIVLVQQLEDRFLVPAVLGRAVNLPPGIVLILLMSAGSLFGVGGLVLAVPVAAAAFVLHDELTSAKQTNGDPWTAYPEGADDDADDDADDNAGGGAG